LTLCKLLTALTAAPQQIELGSIFRVSTYVQHVTVRYGTLRIDTYRSTVRYGFLRYVTLRKDGKRALERYPGSTVKNRIAQDYDAMVIILAYLSCVL